MNLKSPLVLSCIALLSVSSFAQPPKVIRIYPENGATDVKPGPTKIRILFDQDMNTGGYSICGGGENYPKFIGKPQWNGKRSLILNANLEPNHEYTFGINSPSFKNFKSVSGEAAEVMVVTFFTTGKGGQSAAITDEATVEMNQKAFDALKIAVTRNYSYRDFKGQDWNALFDKYQAQFLHAETPEKFISLARLILSKAKDKHIWFQVDDKTIPCYVNPVTPNANLSVLKNLVPNFKKESAIIYSGQFDDGIGYILIDSWAIQNTSELEGFFTALGSFTQAPGLIIDVRGNGGGSEPMARLAAGCFIDEPKLYAKNMNVDMNNPGRFLPVYDRYVEPNKARPQYRGNVAVLIGPVVMSSCEAFVLMMKQAEGCVLVGETTQGSSGNPQPYDLGNHVTVFLPSWQAMLPDGTCFEGKGIAPDIEVKTTPNEITTRDPVIEAALKKLRGN